MTRPKISPRSIAVALSVCSLLFVVYLYRVLGYESSSWKGLSPMSVKRTEAAAAVLGRKIVVVGGFLDRQEATDLVEAYDPATDTWSLLPPLPHAADHIAAAVLDNTLYAIGGYSHLEGGKRFSDVFSFSFETGVWERRKPLPEPRGATSAIAFGEGIHIFGGVGLGGKSDKHFFYDPKQDTWKELSPLPVRNDHMAIGTDGTHIYLSGGKETSPDQLVSMFHIYHPATDSWKEGPRLPTPRGDAYGTMVGGLFVVIGGENRKKKYFPDVDAFDVRQRRWVRLRSTPTPMHGQSVVAIGTALYIIGGRPRDSYTNALRVLDVTR